MLNNNNKSVGCSRFLNFKRALFKTCSGRNLDVINAVGIFQFAWTTKTVQFKAPNVSTMVVLLTAIQAYNLHFQGQTRTWKSSIPGMKSTISGVSPSINFSLMFVIPSPIHSGKNLLHLQLCKQGTNILHIIVQSYDLHMLRWLIYRKDYVSSWVQTFCKILYNLEDSTHTYIHNAA